MARLDALEILKKYSIPISTWKEDRASFSRPFRRGSAPHRYKRARETE